MPRFIPVGVGLCAILVLFVSLLVPVALARPAASTGWTLLVYLDADNDLDPYGYMDIAEMEKVGSTAAVNVVVLWDTYDGPAYLVKILPGSYEVVKGFPLNGKEIDMGSTRTLEAFVDFVLARFPSSKVALVMWDHGDDFRGFGWDEHPGEGAGGSDFLTHEEIIGALQGHAFSILAFDGCVMGNIEVSYEYVARGLSIDYFVASETYIPLEGFAYDKVLAAVSAKPDLDPYDLAKAFVDTYVAFYSGPGWQVGLSVFRMSRMEALVQALGQLTATLELDMSRYRDSIGSARGTAMLSWSLYGWEAYVDLVTWAKALSSYLGTDSEVGPQADAVVQALASAVPYVRNTHTLEVKGAGGMGIFFPGSAGSFRNNAWWYGSYYLQMEFPYHGWLDFLNAYWGGS